MRSMTAVVHRDARLLRLEEIPVPEPAAGEVLVEVLANGICGSDLHVWKLPVREGELRVLGHEIAGRIAGTGVMGAVYAGGQCGLCPLCRAGLGHFCRDAQHLGSTGTPGLGGLAPFVAVRAEHVLPAPVGLEPALITLAEPLANALRALDRPEVDHAATAVIIGCGPLGLVHLAALRHLGVDRVIAIEGRPRRRDAAIELGAEAVLDPREDISARVAAHFGIGPDLVVEAVGTKGTTHLATDLVRPRGSVFLMGVCGEPFRVNTLRWLNKELTIRTSIGASREEHERALSLVASGAIDLSGLITRRVALADAPTMFDALDAGADEIKVVVTHDHGR